MFKFDSVQPLPLDALRDPAFEALFADQAFTTFNPIQTQVLRAPTRLFVCGTANIRHSRALP